jgi:hypothetical protein
MRSIDSPLMRTKVPSAMSGSSSWTSLSTTPLLLLVNSLHICSLRLSYCAQRARVCSRVTLCVYVVTVYVRVFVCVYVCARADISQKREGCTVSACPGSRRCPTPPISLPSNSSTRTTCFLFTRLHPPLRTHKHTHAHGCLHEPAHALSETS